MRSRRTLVSAAAAPTAATGQQVDTAAAMEQLRTKLQLHNSMSRRKELFRPRPEMGDKVQMYVCGVTVYDYSHIGAAGLMIKGPPADAGQLAQHSIAATAHLKYSTAWPPPPALHEAADSRE